MARLSNAIAALATGTVISAMASMMPAPAAAQEWPQRTIRIIVGFGPGGGTDIVGRILAQAMQERLGQPVVVENRPGAGGTVGADAVARADKDGYTLGILTNGHIIAGVLNRSLRYDTLTAFDPIGQIASASLILVTRRDFPANSVKELVEAAKANPGKITFASVGFGGTQHFVGELFKQISGADILHVPYRTSPEAISAVLGRQVDLLFDTISAVLGQVQSGDLKALAVTGKDRFPAVPDVPPAVEFGRASGLRRAHLVRDDRARRHAARGGGQAQRNAQRDLAGRSGERAVDQGGRGAAQLVAGRVRQAHGGRVRALEQGPRGGRHPAAVAGPAKPRDPSSKTPSRRLAKSDRTLAPPL